jgi:hypothetical protein
MAGEDDRVVSMARLVETDADEDEDTDPDS